MQQSIAQELAILGGHTACVVLRLKQEGILDYECLVSIQPERRFSAASLAKVPILVEIAHQVNLGRLSWEERYNVADRDRVAGGVLADLSPQLRPTLSDLAHLMITISDNTASNALLTLVGMEAVNETMLRMGLTTTRLERRFMDFAARQAGRDNWTSADDMARLLAAIATALPERERMLSILLHQNDYSLLSSSWGEDTPFAHKTGWIEGLLHDAGILYPPVQTDAPPQSPLVIAVLTDGQNDKPLTRYVLSRVGRIIYSR